MERWVSYDQAKHSTAHHSTSRHVTSRHNLTDTAARLHFIGVVAARHHQHRVLSFLSQCLLCIGGVEVLQLRWCALCFTVVLVLFVLFVQFVLALVLL